MSTTSTQNAAPSKLRVKLDANTQVSSYDQTSAFLVAGVVVIGVFGNYLVHDLAGFVRRKAHAISLRCTRGIGWQR